MRLVPAKAPSGELIFPIDLANRALEVFPASDVSGSREYRLVRSALAPMAQCCFWEGDPDQWLVFFPIVRPQRIYLDRIRAALASTKSLTPISATPPEEKEGAVYFKVVPEGVLLSSTPVLPKYGFMPMQADTTQPGKISYHSPYGYIPSHYGNHMVAPGPLSIVWEFDESTAAFTAKFSQFGEVIITTSDVHPFLGRKKASP
ncbi:hypothetical protein IT570_05715 [Candidatus Sumerlaeota bacterium]|nr:hypothetical protein [Candidatus Sumerlaeota bacterium]